MQETRFYLSRKRDLQRFSRHLGLRSGRYGAQEKPEERVVESDGLPTGRYGGSGCGDYDESAGLGSLRAYRGIYRSACRM